MTESLRKSESYDSVRVFHWPTWGSLNSYFNFSTLSLSRELLELLKLYWSGIGRAAVWTRQDDCITFDPSNFTWYRSNFSEQTSYPHFVILWFPGRCFPNLLSSHVSNRFQWYEILNNLLKVSNQSMSLNSNIRENFVNWSMVLVLTQSLKFWDIRKSKYFKSISRRICRALQSAFTLP